MKHRATSIFALGTLLALTVGTAAALARDWSAEGSFERTLTVTGPVDLQISTGSGGIQVRTGDANTVRIVGKIRASSGWHISEKEAQEKVKRIEANPPIEQNGNTIRIGHLEDEDLRRNVSISYELVVPRETRLRSETGSGSQTIDGIHGPLEANTGSGSLKMSNIGAEVHASTGSGGIELDGIQGSVRASTGSGHIRALKVAGGFNGRTGSGSVELEQTAPGNSEIETGSGSVEARGVRGSLRVRSGSGGIHAEGNPSVEWRLHTGSGSVSVRLPQDAAFDIRAHTSSGHIRFNHPITVQGSLNPRSIEGKVRGGGFLLDVSTSSGSVEID